MADQNYQSKLGSPDTKRIITQRQELEEISRKLSFKQEVVEQK